MIWCNKIITWQVHLHKYKNSCDLFHVNLDKAHTCFRFCQFFHPIFKGSCVSYYFFRVRSIKSSMLPPNINVFYCHWWSPCCASILRLECYLFGFLYYFAIFVFYCELCLVRWVTFNLIFNWSPILFSIGSRMNNTTLL